MRTCKREAFIKCQEWWQVSKLQASETKDQTPCLQYSNTYFKQGNIIRRDTPKAQQRASVAPEKVCTFPFTRPSRKLQGTNQEQYRGFIIRGHHYPHQAEGSINLTTAPLKTTPRDNMSSTDRRRGRERLS